MLNIRRAGTLLLLCALLPAPILQARAGEEEPPQEAPETRPAAPPPADKPKVFTNADLEKYGAARRAVAPAEPAAVPEEEAEAPPPPPLAPPEERPESATVLELQQRVDELEGLAVYLERKEAWLRNPFLPAPPPPPGEELLDPSRNGGQELRATQSRLTETRNRLIKARLILSSRGA